MMPPKQPINNGNNIIRYMKLEITEVTPPTTAPPNTEDNVSQNKPDIGTV
ncbi:MAG TPA: hypothetical protein VK184_06800 [Nostocaceae cyanobacterium]|nr:hypothetical protein [Nostocaceae cyanobacterium]